MHNVKLRVHISPVGFDVDRIVLPLEQMKADKVWLITAKAQDKAEVYFNKIVAWLKKHKINYDTEGCEITDLYDILKTIRSIVEKEAENDIFINVSTGSKIEAIAGMMACMIFKNGTRIMPYYAVPEEYVVKPTNEETMTKGLKEIKPMPDYRIQQPEKRLISILRIIDKSRGMISKKHLIESAVSEGLIVVSGKNPEQSKYASLNKNFLEPLLSWQLIKVEKESRKKMITLTDEGKNMLKFLG